MKTKNDCVTVIQHYRALWILPYSVWEIKNLVTCMMRAANQTQKGEEITGIELSLVCDADIAIANETFMHCVGPTNILSFPGGCDLPGSLMLSLDTFDRECILYGQDKKQHLLHLLSHGIAHLAQLDHGDAHSSIHDACLAQALQYSRKTEQR